MMIRCAMAVSAFSLTVVLQACSYTGKPATIEAGSEVGGTGDIGFTHEPLSAERHLLTVTAAPGMMETEGSIAQRIHIFANKFAASTCDGNFDFVHDPNFDQTVAAGFMRRTRSYVFVCKG